MPSIANIILPYNGNNATIPSLWSRITDLDAKLAKAWGAQNPNLTGGADQHSHTSSAHAHSETDSHGHYVTYQASGSCASYGGSPNQDAIAQCNHNHSASTITTRTGGNASDTIAYPSVAGNNLPPYHEVIFLKAAVGATLKQNHLVFSDVNETPIGWNIPDGAGGRPDMRNRYLRGAGTGADAGTQAGALTHQHDLSHSHYTVHSHDGRSGGDDNHPTRTNGGGSGGNKTNSHDHGVHLNDVGITTDTYSGSVTSGAIEPAYIKLLTLLNSGTGVLKKGMIAMYLDDNTNLPPGWILCDGRQWTDKTRYTRDLRNKFIKIAVDGTEIGNTGGSNTHDHPASNSHSHSQSGAHAHSGYTDSQGGGAPSGGSTSPSAHNHGLNSVGNNNATLTWDSATMTGESVDNQPAYRTVSYIQLERVDAGAITITQSMG